ncbi:tetratricopeptide repeat protein [Acanthopleuribacter pedis]|uniref:Tetratricopeptide repeat protein n=1 Tax=Acanthopleuribacter pedis TaxID=442870 RepID=A0A8J7Q8F4_9BACT|nr:tetratricopeptide repeat protein [Acanthopleuribacter pedis]MBO1320386.1 tetratricopeptide repeat protein [Acanthopleuribacter pedis]
MSQPSLEQALAHHQAGRLEQAAAGYRALLAVQPRHADALHLLGGVYLQQNNADEAIAWIRKAISVRPRVALYHANLGAAFLVQKQAAAALAACDAALALDTTCAEAHNHRGTALVYLNRPDEAKIAYQQALSHQPNYAEVVANLGNLARAQGDSQAAKQFYRDAVQRDPHNAEACNNLAAVLLTEKQTEEAEHWLLKAVSLNDGLIEAHENLAFVYLLQGRDHEAGVHLKKAAADQPDHALKNLRPLLVFPMIPASPKAVGYARKRFQKNLDRTAPVQLDAYAGELEKSNVHPPFQLAYQGENNRALKQQYAQLFQPGDLAWREAGAPDGHHIGMLVTHGHEGIFLACCKGLIMQWDTQKAPLTVIAPQAAMARLRQALQREDLAWLPVSEKVVEALQQIRRQRFSLVYFWEVGSDSLNYFLALLRVARRQCTSWGSPETTGVPAIDAYLTATSWQDTNPDHYSERLVQLPLIPCYYTPPKQGAQPEKNRRDFGIPEDKPFIFCPQNLFKIHPDFDHLLEKILERNHAISLVFVEGKRKNWTSLLKKRWQRNLGAHAERMRFLPRLDYGDYLTLVRQCDLLLDSLHFSGGNTSFEGLAMGTPIVTLPGTFLRGRFTYGCYQQMGHPLLLDQCVAKDPDDWVTKILRLATDKVTQTQCRKAIKDSCHLLVEREEAAVAFQEALLSLSAS